MSNIDGLAAEWLAAKSAEATANKRRLEIEKELAAALDVKDEGSITHKLDLFKVTLTQPVSRKLDVRAWELVKAQVPESLHPVKVETKADPAGMKWLAEHEPKMWAMIAKAFESKQGKIGVKVEVL